MLGLLLVCRQAAVPDRAPLEGLRGVLASMREMLLVPGIGKQLGAFELPPVDDWRLFVARQRAVSAALVCVSMCVLFGV